MPGLQTFALTLAVAGGARFEDPARSGWSHFLEHLVFKGAGAMSARDIVERIEGEGGTINAATGYERTSSEVRAPASCLARPASDSSPCWRQPLRSVHAYRPAHSSDSTKKPPYWMSRKVLQTIASTSAA